MRRSSGVYADEKSDKGLFHVDLRSLASKKMMAVL